MGLHSIFCIHTLCKGCSASSPILIQNGHVAYLALLLIHVVDISNFLLQYECLPFAIAGKSLIINISSENYANLHESCAKKMTFLQPQQRKKCRYMCIMHGLKLGIATNRRNFFLFAFDTFSLSYMTMRKAE